MTVATMDLDLTGANDVSLTNGDNPALYGTGANARVNRLGPLETYLNGLMVLYSNNQVYDPNDATLELPPLAAPQKAVWQCWMQGKKMGSDLWDASQAQTGQQTCTGNQRRQDGSACSLSASTATTGSATSAATSAASSTAVGSISLSGTGSSNTSSIASSTSTSSSITTIASDNATTTAGPSTTQSSVSNTTTAASATTPSITSCVLTTASAFSTNGESFTASPYCLCNNDLDAGLSTLTMSDGSYELYCALGSPSTIVVSTIAASTTPPPSTTTPLPATLTTSSTPPPSSASPSQIILFSDINCQDWIDTNTYDHYSSSCWEYPDTEINSYIVGTTSGCSCADSDHYCSWDAFVITTSDGCGYDDEVGGGCSGGSQKPTTCNPTTGPAHYITAELSTNGICKRDAENGTMTGDESLHARGFDLEARAAGRIDRRC
ncbi:hypothetical protein LTR85_003680 [Meristemomyces frigidus]|nr:hypothetical protein LTR85_003680 [Meristemomyces frigidus]